MQISTVFGMETMDLNGDGFLDLIAYGNWYEMEIETNIQDAGIGNVLLEMAMAHLPRYTAVSVASTLRVTPRSCQTDRW